MSHLQDPAPVEANVTESSKTEIDTTRLVFQGHSYTPYKDMEDFVLYFRRDTSVQDEKEVYERIDGIAAKSSKRGETINHLDIDVEFSGGWEGRALACRCHGKKAWSLAVRLKPNSDSNNKYILRTLEEKPEWYGFQAGSGHWPSIDALFSVDEICRSLYDLILGDKADPHGIIIITGSTGSAKSQIARGLVHTLLHSKLQKQNVGRVSKIPRPHLISIEKPLESHYLKNKAGTENQSGVTPPGDPGGTPGQPSAQRFRLQDDPVEQQKYGIDFTPRLLEQDTDSVEQALSDALRQKPAVVFLDEVRLKEEWESVLRFAGSGHLIVTTAHAGSLVEAMTWIFDAMDADSPAKRAELAERMLGLVHLRREVFSPPPISTIDLKKRANERPPEMTELKNRDEIRFYSFTSKLIDQKEADLRQSKQADTVNIEEEICAFKGRLEEEIKVLLPTLWRYTPKGINALVADGLSSVAPNNPPSLDPRDDESSLGRRWFVLRLLSTIESNFDVERRRQKPANAAAQEEISVQRDARTETLEELLQIARKSLPHGFFTNIEQRALDLDLKGN